MKDDGEKGHFVPAGERNHSARIVWGGEVVKTGRLNKDVRNSAGFGKTER